MAKAKKLTQLQKDAINKSLLVRPYSDFKQAQETYYNLMGGDFEKKNLKTRGSVNAKQIVDFLADAEFMVISVGTNKLGKVRFCFQKIVDKGDGKYEIVENDSLMTYNRVIDSHPLNGVPVE